MSEKKNEENKIVSIENRKLILIDLDGTTLNKDYKTLNNVNKLVIKELVKRGHMICIATGKNYNSAIKYHKELGLNGLLITYNGAYISDPNVGKLNIGGKLIQSYPINNSIAFQILNDITIRENLKEVLFDTCDNETISTSEGVYWKEVFYLSLKFVKSIQEARDYIGVGNLLQMVLEFPNNDKVDKVLSSLRGKFNSSITFQRLNKLKEEGRELVHDKDSVVIRIRSRAANKGVAGSFVCSYYNIPFHKVYAFGDDKNDVEMLSKFNGYALKNGTFDAKASASAGVTEFNNNSGGVGRELMKIFGINDLEIPEIDNNL